MRRTAAAALALTALAALTGCEFSSASEDTAKVAPSAQPTTTPSKTKTTEPTPTKSPEPSKTTDAPAADTALAALALLPVKGRAPMTGYDRSQFGQEWSDAAGDFDWSRDGCDTRNDVLARDLQREVVESNGCVVTSGVLAYEPYTGTQNYYFDKHDDEYATDLDIEHVVALGNVWVTGGQQLSTEERAAIANDPINLFAADPSSNRQKGDGDAATWLPANKSFRCSYMARQIRVKQTYGLWVTAPEKAAMEQVLAACPNEPLDQPETQDGYTASGDAAQPAPTPTKQPTKAAKPVTKSAPKPGKNVYYENCDAARAAGAAPVRKGDPGYGSHLDRDGDGSACE